MRWTTARGGRRGPPLVDARRLLGDALGARAARLDQARAELEAINPSSRARRILARVLAGLAAAYMLDRDLIQRSTSVPGRSALAAACGDDAAERNAAATVGSCLVFAGQSDDGWRLLEGAVADSRAAEFEAEAAPGLPDDQDGVLRSSSSAGGPRRQAAGRRQLRRDGVKLWNHRHYVAAHLAHVLWATGRWTEAETVAQRALADGRGGIATGSRRSTSSGA